MQPKKYERNWMGEKCACENVLCCTQRRHNERDSQHAYAFTVSSSTSIAFNKTFSLCNTIRKLLIFLGNRNRIRLLSRLRKLKRDCSITERPACSVIKLIACNILFLYIRISDVHCMWMDVSPLPDKNICEKYHWIVSFSHQRISVEWIEIKICDHKTTFAIFIRPNWKENCVNF